MTPRKPTPKNRQPGAEPTKAQLAAENAALRAELAEAREQQAATAEILGVISRSPADVQPVFDAIARTAARLLGADTALVTRYDGILVHLVSHHDMAPELTQRLRGRYPRPADRDFPVGVAILDRTTCHAPDIQATAEFAELAASFPRLRGVIGCRSFSTAGRSAPSASIASPEGLLQQPDRAPPDLRRPGRDRPRERPAVQRAGGSERDLTEALEQQTATAEILR